MNTYPQTDSQLTEQLWQVMQWHKGYLHRIDRADLTQRIFGRVTESLDRKVRDALSELPIVWNDGYFVPITRAEAEGYIASMRARQKAISERISTIESYLRKENEPIEFHQPILIQF